MARNRYEVTLAGGEKVVVEAPEGALGSEIYQLAIDKNKADREAIKNRPGFWDSAAMGLRDATLGAVQGIQAATGLGDEEQTRKNILDAMENRPRGIGFTDIGGVKDFFDWGSATLGGTVGALAPAAVAGITLGPAAGVGVLGAGHFGGNIRSQLLEQERFKQEGKYVPQTDVGAAVLASAGQTALDLITFRAARIQEQFGFKISEQEALRRAEMDVAKQAGVASEGYLGSAGVGAMRAAPVEAGTEVAQQGLERWQAGQDLTGEDAMRDYIESAAGGALGGAALGTLGRRLEVGQAQQEVSAREALAQQQAQAQQEQLQVQQAAEQERQRREGVFQQGMAQAEQLDAFGVPEDIAQPPAAPLPNTQGITQMPQFEAPVEQTAVQDEEKAYAAERVQRGKQEVKRLLGEGKIQEAAALQEQLIKETANLKQMGWVDPEAENTIVKNLSKVDSKIESLSQELMSVNTEGGTAKVLEKLQAVQDQRNNLQAQLDEIRKVRAPDTQEKFDFGTRAQEQTQNTGSAYDKPTDQNSFNGNAYAQRIFEAMGNNAPFTLSAEDMKDLGIVGARLRRDYPQFDLTNPEQRAAFKEALTAYDAEKTERGKPNPNRTSFIEALDQLDAQVKEKPVLEFTPSPRTEEQQAAEQARLGENLQQVEPAPTTPTGEPIPTIQPQPTTELQSVRNPQARLPLRGGKFGETENESGLKDWPTAQETQNATQEQGTREVPMGEQPQAGEGVRVENQPRAEEAPAQQVEEKEDSVRYSATVPKEIRGVVSGLREMLRIPKETKLHLISTTDLKEGRVDLEGEYKGIKETAEKVKKSEGGVTGRLPDGSSYIIYDSKGKTSEQLEVLAHELGHIHEREVFYNAPQNVQLAIYREYEKWRKGKSGVTPREFINALRAKNSAKSTKLNPFTKTAKDMKDYNSYWSTFDEWYADQVSRWAVSSEKPVGLVEQFFARLGRALRNFYNQARNAGWLPNETFKQYLDNIHKMPIMAEPEAKVQPETTTKEMRTSAVAATPQTQPQNLLQQIQTVPKSAMEKAFGWVMKNLDAGYGISEKYRQDETIPDEEKRALEHSARIGMISLAGHLNAVATEALRMGGIEYSKEFGKLQAVEGNGVSGEHLNKQVHDMAKAHGIEYIEARKIVHDALEGKRVLSLYKQQAQNEADAQALEAKNPKKYAKTIKELRAKLGSEPFHITEAEAKKQADLFNQYPELKEIDKTKEGIRKWVADFLVDSGNWSKDQAEALLSNADWVPFQRKFDDNLDSDPSDFIKYHQSLQATYKSQKFKNSEREVNDILDNFDNWAMYAIRTAAKNYTVKTILQDALQRFGGAENGVRPISFTPTGKNHHVAFYFDKGHKHMVYFDNPLEASFFNSGFATPQVSKVIEFFNSMFRLSIVANPVFSVGQVMKDSIQAITKSGLPPREAIKIPLAAMKEMALLMRGRESETHKKLKSLGLVGAATDLATVNMEDLRQALGYHDLGQENKNVFKKLQNYGLKMAMWSDNAVRQAVYKAAIESGQTPTNASTLAANIINFRTQMGNHGLMFVASYVPFMRAGLADLRASLYTMSNRSLSSIDRKTAKQNYIRTLSMMTGLSVLSAMALSDDEDYENMSPEQRARQWTIPGMGGFGVPRRVTLDSVPVVLAELVVNQFSKNATDSTRARTALSGIAGQVLMPIPDTLPAPIKAFIEQKTNYDWFTGDKIVGGTLERVQPYKQYGSGTSSLAKSLGEGFDMLGMGNWDAASPKRIDHFIRSMLGSVGSAVLLSSNIIGSTFGNRPAMSSNDMMASIPGLSMPAAKEFNSSDRQDLYDFMDRVNTVVQTAKAIEKEGDSEELQKYYANNQELLKYEKTVRNISGQLSKVRAAIKLVSERPGDNANKTEEVRRLKEIETRLVKNLDVKQLRQGAGL